MATPGQLPQSPANPGNNTSPASPAPIPAGPAPSSAQLTAEASETMQFVREMHLADDPLFNELEETLKEASDEYDAQQEMAVDAAADPSTAPAPPAPAPAAAVAFPTAAFFAPVLDTSQFPSALAAQGTSATPAAAGEMAIDPVLERKTKPLPKRRGVKSGKKATKFANLPDINVAEEPDNLFDWDGVDLSDPDWNLGLQTSTFYDFDYAAENDNSGPATQHGQDPYDYSSYGADDSAPLHQYEGQDILDLLFPGNIDHLLSGTDDPFVTGGGATSYTAEVVNDSSTPADTQALTAASVDAGAQGQDNSLGTDLNPGASTTFTTGDDQDLIAGTLYGGALTAQKSSVNKSLYPQSYTPVGDGSASASATSTGAMPSSAFTFTVTDYDAQPTPAEVASGKAILDTMAAMNASPTSIAAANIPSADIPSAVDGATATASSPPAPPAASTSPAPAADSGIDAIAALLEGWKASAPAGSESTDMSAFLKTLSYNQLENFANWVEEHEDMVVDAIEPAAPATPAPSTAPVAVSMAENMAVDAHASTETGTTPAPSNELMNNFPELITIDDLGQFQATLDDLFALPADAAMAVETPADQKDTESMAVDVPGPITAAGEAEAQAQLQQLLGGMSLGANTGFFSTPMVTDPATTIPADNADNKITVDDPQHAEDELTAAFAGMSTDVFEAPLALGESTDGTDTTAATEPAADGTYSSPAYTTIRELDDDEISEAGDDTKPDTVADIEDTDAATDAVIAETDEAVQGVAQLFDAFCLANANKTVVEDKKADDNKDNCAANEGADEDQEADMDLVTESESEESEENAGAISEAAAAALRARFRAWLPKPAKSEDVPSTPVVPQNVKVDAQPQPAEPIKSAEPAEAVQPALATQPVHDPAAALRAKFKAWLPKPAENEAPVCAPLAPQIVEPRSDVPATNPVLDEPVQIVNDVQQTQATQFQVAPAHAPLQNAPQDLTLQYQLTPVSAPVQVPVDMPLDTARDMPVDTSVDAALDKAVDSPHVNVWAPPALPSSRVFFTWTTADMLHDATRDTPVDAPVDAALDMVADNPHVEPSPVVPNDAPVGMPLETVLDTPVDTPVDAALDKTVDSSHADTWAPSPLSSSQVVFTWSTVDYAEAASPTSIFSFPELASEAEESSANQGASVGSDATSECSDYHTACESPYSRSEFGSDYSTATSSYWTANGYDSDKSDSAEPATLPQLVTAAELSGSKGPEEVEEEKTEEAEEQKAEETEETQTTAVPEPALATSSTTPPAPRPLRFKEVARLVKKRDDRLASGSLARKNRHPVSTLSSQDRRRPLRAAFRREALIKKGAHIWAHYARSTSRSAMTCRWAVFFIPGKKEQEEKVKEVKEKENEKEEVTEHEAEKEEIEKDEVMMEEVPKEEDKVEEDEKEADVEMEEAENTMDVDEEDAGEEESESMLIDETLYEWVVPLRKRRTIKLSWAERGQQTTNARYHPYQTLKVLKTGGGLTRSRSSEYTHPLSSFFAVVLQRAAGVVSTLRRNAAKLTRRLRRPSPPRSSACSSGSSMTLHSAGRFIS